MRVVAVTKFKQADIYEAMKRIGWNQSELARRSGISPCVIGQIINLEIRPTKNLASKIQKALAESGEFIDILATWPELFKGFKKAPVLEQIQDVDFSRVIGQSSTPLLAVVKDERDEAVRKIVNTLDPQQKEVIESRMRGETLEEVGKRMGVTRERIRQIEAKAIKSMQYPGRRKIVEDFIDIESEESRGTI
jgi:RNA polymerase sigma factor (sigma-70 family)